VILGFRHHWRLTWPELWKRLGDSSQAPDDLFITLYRTANDFFLVPTTGTEIDLIVNDPTTAEKAFKALSGEVFESESKTKAFLETLFNSIQEFERPALTSRYKQLVSEFIANHNLRYKILEPFRIQPLVTGIFVQLYCELERSVSPDNHLKQLFEDFERAFATYIDTTQEGDLKRCIASASILAEGIAGKSLNQHGRTLGHYCDEMACWPHATVKDALKKMYGFCSDYPGIRHAGSPRGQLRPLEAKDAFVVCSLIAFLGYLSQDVDIAHAVS
jgi:hypothetical protein